MVRKEPKLRPSISWEDLELATKAIDFYIQHCVSTQQVTLETVKLNEGKKYFESFRPVNTQASALAEFIKTFGATALPKDIEQVAITMDSNDPKQTFVSVETVSQLAMPDLTDEQRYDMIKLRKEITWSEDEKTFMLNTGTMIMLKRASIKTVNAGDL